MGLRDPATVQKLCALPKLGLKTATDICRAEEAAQRDSSIIVGYQISKISHRPGPTKKEHGQKCSFCGGNWHSNLTEFPAKNVVCRNCSKRGHFAKVCRQRNQMRRSDRGTTQSSKDCHQQVTTIIASLYRDTLADGESESALLSCFS